MKSLLTVGVALMALPVLTTFGGPTETSSKAVVAPPPPIQESLYRAHEWDLDLFGAYAPAGRDGREYLGDHAWGGGVAGTYFFTRNLGLGLEGLVLDGTGQRSGDVSGEFALNAIGRLPIGNTPWAPYALAGIGGFVPGSGSNFFNTFYRGVRREIRNSNNEDILLEGHVGLGIEYRFRKNIGLFTDGRYEFVDKPNNNFGLVRAGVRFAF
ncbi:MAG TPA: outer membrane beta-barrel protein [Chthoniobacterales bacterium]